MRVKVTATLACFIALSFGASAGLGQKAKTSAPKPQPSDNATQDSANELSVAVGKSVLVDCAKPVQRVSVGLGELAEATAVSPTEILVNGKAAGETSLIIWEADGQRQFFNVTIRPGTIVTEDHLEALRRELRAELPDQQVKMTSEEGTIFLRGTVKDLSASERAVKIAGTAGKVVNLLYVQVPTADPQIMLKVRFASVDRNKSKSFGINIFSTGLGNTIGAVSTGQYSPPSVTVPTAGAVSTANLANELNLFAFYPGLDLGATIEALESKGLVEVLAEPNVLAQNGKQASFLAGGEYPFPVVQGTATGGAGSVTIQFKEYGVRLNFLPVVTPRGTIRLQVAPEVSSLDFSNAIEISGFNVPAISTRKVKTEVELADGQSFVIGGLLDNRETDTFEKVPFLGDIPILGKFFQSMTKNRTNTELIVIVTPEIVAPLPVGAPLPQLKYPAKFLESNSNIPMMQPDGKTPANTPPPAPASMPVEQLLQTMKPEPSMTIEGGGTAFGAASNGQPTAPSGGGSSPQ